MLPDLKLLAIDSALRTSEVSGPHLYQIHYPRRPASICLVNCQIRRSLSVSVSRSERGSPAKNSKGRTLHPRRSECAACVILNILNPPLSTFACRKPLCEIADVTSSPSLSIGAILCSEAVRHLAALVPDGIPTTNIRTCALSGYRRRPTFGPVFFVSLLRLVSHRARVLQMLLRPYSSLGKRRGTTQAQRRHRISDSL